MFQGIKDLASNASQMAKLKSAQDKMQKAMKSVIVTGISKNGKVSVTLDGENTMVDLKIDPEFINFVSENFTKDLSDKDKTYKGQQMIKNSLVEAVEVAKPKVQAEMIKMMQTSGDFNEMMGMLGGK